MKKITLFSLFGIRRKSFGMSLKQWLTPSKPERHPTGIKRSRGKIRNN